MKNEKITVNDNIKNAFKCFPVEMDWETLVIEYQDSKEVFLKVKPLDKSFKNSKYYSVDIPLNEIDLGDIEPNYYDKDGKILTEYSLVKIFHYQKNNRKHYLHKLIVFNRIDKKWEYAHLNGDVIMRLEYLRPIPIERKIDWFAYVGK